jgi:Phage tail lysozyme
MPVRSVIDIELNDAAWNKFQVQYKAYEAALAASPAAWAAVNKEIDGSRKSFDELVEAAKVRQINAKLNAEAEKVASEELKRQTGETTAQARSWESMAKNSKDFASHVVGATKSLLRWAEVTGVISGLLGAGGLFGIDRLAQSVAGQRKDASGIGVTPGELKSFNLNFGRVLDSPGGFLTGVFESLTDVTKAAPYGALGLNYNQERNKGPEDAAIDVLRGVKRLADRTAENQLGNVFSSRQLSLLGLSLEDFQRIKNRPASELEDYIRRNRRDRNDLNLDPKTQRAWEDFKVKLDRAGDKIEQTFVVGLTNLAKPLGHLSDSFVHVVEAFAGSDKLKHFIDEIATDIDRFAVEIGKPEFMKSVTDFADGMGTLATNLKADLPGIKSAFDAVAAFGSIIGHVLGPVINGTPPDPDHPLPNDPSFGRAPAAPPFHWWNPGSWFDHAPGTGPSPRSSPFPGGASTLPASPAAFRSFVGPSPAITGSRVVEAHDFFVRAGWTEAQTAGLLANIGAESGFRPNAMNASGHQGIAQWDSTRAARFRRIFGHDPAQGTFEEQLMFLQMELLTTEKKAGDRLRGARTAGESAAVINEGYERSGTNSGARAGAAGQYMQQFKDRSVTVKVENRTGGNANITVSQLAV